METTLMFVAGGAVVLAILIAAFKKKTTPKQEEKPAGSTYFAPQAAAPRAAASTNSQTKRSPRNKRGWRAPMGHYFDDDDCLFTDAGDAILDMMIIAELCGADYDGPIESNDLGRVEPATLCCSEASASATACCSETSEVTSKSDFSDLQTERAPAPSYSAPEPASYGGGGGESCDSGGDCGDSDD